MLPADYALANGGNVSHVGSGQSNASNITGTLAWAIMTANALESGITPQAAPPYYGLDYYRYRTNSEMGYNPNRNLRDVNIPATVAPDCDSPLVRCMPGPCLVWEIDYQYTTLKRLQTHTPFDEALPNSTTIPMIGTARCGPLFNTQFLAASHLGFDATESLQPSDINSETLAFLPTLLSEPQIIYGTPTAKVPAASGENLNPRWYYEGYGKAGQAGQATLNWMYNENPALIPGGCRGLSPPPFAPAAVKKKQFMARPLTQGPKDANGPGLKTNWKDPVPQARGPQGKEMGTSFTDELTGNPRLQSFSSAGSNTRYTVLTGYVRGSEDRVASLSGATEGETLYGALSSTGVLLDKLKVADHLNNTYGQGINHHITPQERPRAWDQNMCDFTQCRWIPAPDPAAAPELTGTMQECRKNPAPPPKFYAAQLLPCAVTEMAGVEAPDETARIRCYGSRFTLLEAPLVRSNDTSNFLWKTCNPNITDDPDNEECRNSTGPWNTSMDRTNCCGVPDPSWSQLNASNSFRGQCLQLSQYATTVQNIAPSTGMHAYFNSYHEKGDIPKSLKEFTLALKTVTNSGANSSAGRCGSFYQRDIEAEVYYIGDALDWGSGHDCPSTNNHYINATQFNQGCQNSNWEWPDANLDVTMSKHTECNTNANKAIIDNNRCKALGNNPYDADGQLALGGSTTTDHDYFHTHTWCRRPEIQEDPYKDKYNFFNLVPQNFIECLKGDWEPTDWSKNPADDKFMYSRRVPMVAPHAEGQGHTLSNRYLTQGPVALSRGLYFGTTTSNRGLCGDNMCPHDDDSARIRIAPELTPGFPKMQCVADADARVMLFGDTWGNLNKDKKGDECKRHGSSTLTPDFANISLSDGANIGILMAQEGTGKPITQSTLRYSPLTAYKNEQRRVKPVATATRLASFHNTQLKSNSFACDCGASPIAWFHDDPPVRSSMTGGSKGGARWVVSGYGWQSLRVSSSPAMGLYLPSSKSTVRIVERDFLFNTKKNEPRNAIEINSTIDGAHMPGLAELPGMVFDGARYPTDKTRARRGAAKPSQGDDKHLVSVHTFNRGSCMRWPYGQIPRMAFEAGALDAHAQKNKSHFVQGNIPVPFDNKWCTVDADNGVRSCVYEEEAMLGYCEPVVADFAANVSDKLSRGVLSSGAPYQHCWQDPMIPEDRNAFCAANGMAAQVLIWQKVIGDRGVDEVCNIHSGAGHKQQPGGVCLIIPGTGHFGQLSALVRALKHKAAGVTFLVAPFNLTMIEYYTGHYGGITPVGHGYRAGTEPDPSLSTSGSNITGFTANETAFNTITNLKAADATIQSVKDAVAAVARAAFLGLGAAAHTRAQCEDTEYAVPAPTNSPGPARCVKWDDIFAPVYDPQIVLEHPGVTVESAMQAFDNRPTPLHYARPLDLYMARSQAKCTVFNVAAENVRIGPATFNTTNCRNLNNMDMTPIVLAGKSVAGFNAEGITVKGPDVKTGIIFAGDDTDVARGRNDVNTTNVAATILVESEATTLRYHAAMARAYGSGAQFTCKQDGRENKCRIAIMPVAREEIRFAENNHSITNLSTFLSEMGSGFLHTLFPLKMYRHEYQWILFAVYTSTLIVATTTLAILAHKATRLYDDDDDDAAGKGVER